eukprot:1139345-Pelagomonas_calceolata.AAC.12
MHSHPRMIHVHAHACSLWPTQASIPPFDLEENPEEDTGAGGQQIGKGYEKGRAPPAGASCTLRTFSSTPGSSIAHPKQKHSILYYRMLTVRHLAGGCARKIWWSSNADCKLCGGKHAHNIYKMCPWVVGFCLQ